MSLHRKRKPLNERSFEIDLENVSRNTNKPRVNISLINQKSNSQSKTISNFHYPEKPPTEIIFSIQWTIKIYICYYGRTSQ